MLHLTDTWRVTFCGKTIVDADATEEGEEVTDAYVEVAADPQTHDACEKCARKGKMLVDADDASWRQEIAMETGMLHGIDAYNDIRGY